MKLTSVACLLTIEELHDALALSLSELSRPTGAFLVLEDVLTQTRTRRCLLNQSHVVLRVTLTLTFRVTAGSLPVWPFNLPLQFQISLLPSSLSFQTSFQDRKNDRFEISTSIFLIICRRHVFVLLPLPLVLILVLTIVVVVDRHALGMGRTSRGACQLAVLTPPPPPTPAIP